MTPITDHPLRFKLANELHARPFPSFNAPATVAFLAIKKEDQAAGRDRDGDLAHLIALLDRYGAPHPRTQLGRFRHNPLHNARICGDSTFNKAADVRHTSCVVR